MEDRDVGPVLVQERVDEWGHDSEGHLALQGLPWLQQVAYVLPKREKGIILDF